MRFSEVYEYYKQGKKIRRKEWSEHTVYTPHDRNHVHIDNVLATDWEVVDEENKDYEKGYQDGYLDGLKNGYKQALESIQKESHSIKPVD